MCFNNVRPWSEERALERGRFGAAYKVEHAIEHTLHGIGAGIDHGLHTHVFHSDSNSDTDEQDEEPRGSLQSSSESDQQQLPADSDTDVEDVSIPEGGAEEAEEPYVEPVFRDVSGDLKSTQSTPSIVHASSSSESAVLSPISIPISTTPSSKWPVQLGAMPRKQAQRAVLATLNGGALPLTLLHICFHHHLSMTRRSRDACVPL